MLKLLRRVQVLRPRNQRYYATFDNLKTGKLHARRPIASYDRIDPDIIQFGLGASPFPIPSCMVDRLADCAEANRYTHPAGTEAIRKAIARSESERLEIDVNPENVIVGPGTKHLLYLLAQVFPGRIIFPMGSWAYYLSNLNLRSDSLSYPLITRDQDRWLLSPESLDTHASPAPPSCLILNSPGNPHGQIYSDQQLADLAEVARRNEVVVVSDEIYSGMCYDQPNAPSIAKYYPEGTIVGNGLSKTHACGGWRFGYFIMPDPLLRVLGYPIIDLLSKSIASVPEPIQIAAMTAYDNPPPEIEDQLWKQRFILGQLSREISDEFEDTLVRVRPAQGGFNLLLDFGHVFDHNSVDIYNDVDLCAALFREARVMLVPGSVFGYPNDAYLCRMAFVDFDGSDALSLFCKPGIEGPLLHNPIFENVRTGVERIKQWCEIKKAETYLSA